MAKAPDAKFTKSCLAILQKSLLLANDLSGYISAKKGLSSRKIAMMSAVTLASNSQGVRISGAVNELMFTSTDGRVMDSSHSLLCTEE